MKRMNKFCALMLSVALCAGIHPIQFKEDIDI